MQLSFESINVAIKDLFSLWWSLLINFSIFILFDMWCLQTCYKMEKNVMKNTKYHDLDIFGSNDKQALFYRLIFPLVGIFCFLVSCTVYGFIDTTFFMYDNIFSRILPLIVARLYSPSQMPATSNLCPVELVLDYSLCLRT